MCRSAHGAALSLGGRFALTPPWLASGNGGYPLTSWHFAQEDQAEEFAEVRVFTMKKRQPGGDVAFRITLKEFAVAPPGQYDRFFAEADKAVNQKRAPIVPSGWGDTALKALADCMRMIRQFPYEGE